LQYKAKKKEPLQVSCQEKLCRKTRAKSGKRWERGQKKNFWGCKKPGCSLQGKRKLLVWRGRETTERRAAEKGKVQKGPRLLAKPKKGWARKSLYDKQKRRGGGNRDHGRGDTKKWQASDKTWVGSKKG